MAHEITITNGCSEFRGDIDTLALALRGVFQTRRVVFQLMNSGRDQCARLPTVTVVALIWCNPAADVALQRPYADGLRLKSVGYVTQRTL